MHAIHIRSGVVAAVFADNRLAERIFALLRAVWTDILTTRAATEEGIVRLDTIRMMYTQEVNAAFRLRAHHLLHDVVARFHAADYDETGVAAAQSTTSVT